MEGKESRLEHGKGGAPLTVYSFAHEASVDVVSALPRATQRMCWNGTLLDVPLSWSVALDPSTLWFVCSLPGGTARVPNDSAGAFIEGLWEGDVAELFVKGEDGSYQEINLSPSGAWWSMTLSSYRERRERPRRPVPRHIASSVKDDRWEVVAGFELNSLEVKLLPSSRIHVSGMWYSPEPRYLSSNPARGVAPDYHHDGCFQGVSLVKG